MLLYFNFIRVSPSPVFDIGVQQMDNQEVNGSVSAAAKILWTTPKNSVGVVVGNSYASNKYRSTSCDHPDL